jgi:hypothetical protein
MERMFLVEECSAGESISVQGKITDGLQQGTFIQTCLPWAPGDPFFLSQLQVWVGMDLEEFRAWRLAGNLSAKEAIQKRMVGSVYRVRLRLVPTGEIVEWLERISSKDPFAVSIHSLMKELGYSRDNMQTLCWEEFGVESYDQLSIVDREQLIQLLRERIKR